MRSLELLFDQDIRVNASTSSVAPWDSIQPKVVETSAVSFSAESRQLQQAHQSYLILLELWVRVESKGEEPVTEMPTTIVQHHGFHLEINLHGLTSHLRFVTVTDLGKVSSSVTAQNNKAICLNTEGDWRHTDSTCLWFILSHNSAHQICMKFHFWSWHKLAFCMITASNCGIC